MLWSCPRPVPKTTRASAPDNTRGKKAVKEVETRGCVLVQGDWLHPFLLGSSINNKALTWENKLFDPPPPRVRVRICTWTTCQRNGWSIGARYKGSGFHRHFRGGGAKSICSRTKANKSRPLHVKLCSGACSSLVVQNTCVGEHRKDSGSQPAGLVLNLSTQAGAAQRAVPRCVGGDLAA